LRIFLNENVKKGFGFNDSVDYCYRDMGIDENFLDCKASAVDKEYEFVYVGAVSKERNIDKLLKRFAERQIGKILLIGNIDDEIYREFKKYKNIIFVGKVSYLEVPKIASKAVYGVNFIPNKYPYNIQTSTKLLEYLALGLKIVTTDYKWIRDFEAKYNCSFFKVDEKKIDLDAKKLEKFKFIVNGFRSQDFLWKNIIKKSGIEGKILNLLDSFG
jgi:glycosyltransferase involved in cell wall biosynthesis